MLFNIVFPHLCLRDIWTMSEMQHKSYKSFDRVKGANIHMMGGCQSSQQALYCNKTVIVIHFMLGLIDVSDVWYVKYICRNILNLLS